MKKMTMEEISSRRTAALVDYLCRGDRAEWVSDSFNHELHLSRLSNVQGMLDELSLKRPKSELQLTAVGLTRPKDGGDGVLVRINGLRDGRAVVAFKRADSALMGLMAFFVQLNSDSVHWREERRDSRPSDPLPEGLEPNSM